MPQRRRLVARAFCPFSHPIPARFPCQDGRDSDRAYALFFQLRSGVRRRSAEHWNTTATSGRSSPRIALRATGRIALPARPTFGLIARRGDQGRCHCTWQHRGERADRQDQRRRIPKEVMPPPVDHQEIDARSKKTYSSSGLPGGPTYQLHWSLIPPKRPELPASQRPSVGPKSDRRLRAGQARRERPDTRHPRPIAERWPGG